MPIEKDDLTNQLKKIAHALDTGIGSGPDTIQMAVMLMFQASARLKAYEDRIEELERWQEDH